ncbi:MAG: hypothetical protein K8R50_08335 [Betaproteobacteria bacterium]|nr:hypothetical protein [Betaproteobacteria bacterium]
MSELAEDLIWQRNQEVQQTFQHSSNESDRGITLIIAAHIEECLRRLIESFLINSSEVEKLFEGSYAPFGSLSGKTKAAYVMGLITKDELRRIDAVRNVRNVFAHHIDANFEHPKIKKICEAPPIYDGRLCNRDAFLHTAQNTVFPILYRDINLGKAWKRRELTISDFAKQAKEAE